METTNHTFAQLLDQAVRKPGIVSQAYFAFHNYSVGNQILAMMQCLDRGLQPGPLSTFMGWKRLGRHVRKGEKALTLCRPIAVTIKPTDDDDTEAEQVITKFIYRPYWFVLSQTDGPDIPPVPVLPDWDRAHALATLGITEEPFTDMDGNMQGYARERTIAISPLAQLPHKTTFHELAHVLLGHTSDGEFRDGKQMSRNLRECEAEAVALVCCAALELPGVEYSRGYIQSWWGPNCPIPEWSAQRILRVADQILKAGTPMRTTDDDVA